MTQDAKRTFGHRALQWGAIVAVVGGVCLLGLLGWQWRASATVSEVTVHGVHHASPDTVRQLAAVERGTVMSMLDPAVVGDRVARHPWVDTAEVAAHWMTGTLEIAVTEHSPAALVVDAEGQPAYYLAASGHGMPLPDSTGYDVPLIRGLDADYRPVGRLAPESVRHLLQTLPEAEATELVAEIEVNADRSLELVTTPLGARGALTVRLGTGGFDRKLRTLRRFSQQVLSRTPSETDHEIEEVDLRFAGQVVTREQSLDK